MELPDGMMKLPDGMIILTGMIIPAVREMRLEGDTYSMVEIRPQRVVSDAIGKATRGLSLEAAHIVADNLS